MIAANIPELPLPEAEVAEAEVPDAVVPEPAVPEPAVQGQWYPPSPVATESRTTFVYEDWLQRMEDLRSEDEQVDEIDVGDDLIHNLEIVEEVFAYEGELEDLRDVEDFFFELDQIY